jgi:bacteriophage N4 adsorption protein B
MALFVLPLGWAAHWLASSTPAAADPLAARLVLLNLLLLGWRLAVRMVFVGRLAGWRSARWVPVRMVVANFIALVATGRALRRYLRMLRGAAPVWDKTAHHFPAELAG